MEGKWKKKKCLFFVGPPWGWLCLDSSLPQTKRSARSILQPRSFLCPYPLLLPQQIRCWIYKTYAHWQLQTADQWEGKKDNLVKSLFQYISFSLPSYILPNSQSKAHRLIQNNLLREFRSVALLSTPVSIQRLAWLWLDLLLSFSS